MPLNVAFLDDNTRHLKHYKKLIEDDARFKVIVYADNTKDFHSKYENYIHENEDIIDLLILDIELTNESVTGIDIVMELKKHTIFTSEDNGNYIREFEQIEDDYNVFIEHISKPFSDTFFRKKLDKMYVLIEHFKSNNTIKLKLKKGGENLIKVDDIVMIVGVKENNSVGHDKTIYFTNRPVDILTDFSFKHREKLGFDCSKFIQVQKSYIVNIKFISKPLKGKFTVEFHKGSEEISIGEDFKKKLPNL